MFTRSLTRRAFSLPQAPTRFQNKMYINGEFVNAASGQTFGTYNPATEALITEVPEAGEEDVNRAVEAARNAFDHGPWSRTSGHERSKLMHRFADLLEQNADELAALEALDNGKHVSIAQAADIHLVIRQFRSYAGWADKYFGDVVPIHGPYFQYNKHEPVGVAAQIIPWNFPALMAAWKWGPALATGCVTITKVAEQTPLSALRMAEISHEAGFPKGVINVLTGQGSCGSQLAKHRDVDKVAFTGSTEVGYDIMRNSHPHNLKRISLELGGKSANIIMDDADIDFAIEQAHFSLFFNAGQCCCAGSRAFVHEKIYDQFVERAAAHASKLRLGG
jgi:aldehyde dehydrogenase (NAD+)